MYIIYMLRGFLHSTWSLIHYFISIWEFLLPFYQHHVFDYLINFTLQFLCIFYGESLATIKNCIWVFSLCVEVLSKFNIM
jgi:hypothetical protein